MPPKFFEIRGTEITKGGAFGETSLGIEIRLDGIGDGTELGVMEMTASERLVQMTSDLDFYDSLESNGSSRSVALLDLNQAPQPGATGLASRRVTDFNFADPDATVVMSGEQRDSLLARMNARDTLVYVPNQLPVFGIGDQRTPFAARLLSGASQFYGGGFFGETFGIDHYRVEGYGKGTGIRTEQDAHRVRNELQGLMKPEEWKSVAFLFSNDAASRARILDLRAKVAVKLEGRCESIKQAREAVFDVLKSEGADLRDLDQKSLVALLSKPDFQSDNRAFQQAYAGFKQNFAVLFDLIFQVLPDNIPVYRGVEVAHMGTANPDGKSYWGVGDVGLNVARQYGAANEGKEVRVIQTTLGELRSRGVIKPDHVAVLGNAIEFFHGPDGLGRTTVVPYRVVE